MSSINETQRTSMGSHDRKLRYKVLSDKLSTTLYENNHNAEETSLVETTIQEVQTLHAEGDIEERVMQPREVYLDSRVLRTASDIAVRATESISGNVNTYDKDELAHHIRENPSMWCFSFPREVATVSFLYGTFAPTPPELRPRAPRRLVQRQQAQALKAPANVEKLQKVEEGSQMISKVYKFISKTYDHTREPVSYFHTVLDPTSFSATIENIYYVSFLVRDTLISVYLDEEFGLPFITPLKKSGEKKDIAEENQFLVSMDQERWQDLIKAFGITRPMMVFKR